MAFSEHWEGGWQWCVGRCQRQTGMIGSLCSTHLFFVSGQEWLSFPSLHLQQVLFRWCRLELSLSESPTESGAKIVRACQTYHHMVKQKLPGMAQFLVEEHVKEVIDEVTCREKATLSSLRLGMHSVAITRHISLTIEALSVTSVSSGPCFHDDHNGDASWRPYSYLLIPPLSYHEYPWWQLFKK